jgi:hypothetical protein
MIHLLPKLQLCDFAEADSNMSLRGATVRLFIHKAIKIAGLPGDGPMRSSYHNVVMLQCLGI